MASAGRRTLGVRTDKEVDSPVSDQNVVEAKTDVVLVGAGIMSATMGAILRQLQPDWSISVFERLDAAAAESSDPWNNAGTGHSALCELNYTPEKADGTVDITKAVNVNEQFQVSRQFWAYAVDNGILTEPKEFINPIPHVSFVHGADNVKYLRARYDALAGHPLFAGMEYSESPELFAQRLPLMAKGRDFSDPVALNWTEAGTDVDFGALTRQWLNYLASSGGTVYFGHEVRDLSKQSDGSWTVQVVNRRTGAKRSVNAKFVFVGAGGGALHLLQKSAIEEIKGFGGFPVSGEFLRCTNRELIDQHRAKVYGKAAVGAPPMSVPHLDTRVIGGRTGLLYGPYAGFSPRFLKQGKLNDGRIETLAEFVPEARAEDWQLITAGQRVQVIRRQKGKGGVLEFGTAVVSAADGTIAGLLGASPGASTAVPAMFDVLQRCFPKRIAGWEPKLKEMVPSFGVALSDNAALYREVWEWGTRSLQLGTPVPATPVAESAAV